MKTLAVYSMKGGVGKTTIAVNLACLAARDGRRTLLVDLDTQGAASFFFKVDADLKKAARLVSKGSKQIIEALRGSDVEGLDILPSGKGLRHLDLEMSTSTAGLEPLFKRLAGEYDLVVVDSPPQIGPTGDALLAACDTLVVPVIPSPLSTRTLELLDEHLDKQARKRIYPFFSMVDMRKKIHRETMEALRGKVPRLLDTSIPFSAAFETMGIRQEALVEYSPGSKGGQALIALYQELKDQGVC